MKSFADHRIVQALHHAPYRAALKSLGAGSHQPPKLCQFAVPSGKGIVQVFDNPVLIQGFTFFPAKEMTVLLKSKTVAVFFHHHTLCGWVQWENAGFKVCHSFHRILPCQ